MSAYGSQDEPVVLAGILVVDGGRGHQGHGKHYCKIIRFMLLSAQQYKIKIAQVFLLP
jgi:hypothetical protein